MNHHSCYNIGDLNIQLRKSTQSMDAGNVPVFCFFSWVMDHVTEVEVFQVYKKKKTPILPEALSHWSLLPFWVQIRIISLVAVD